MKYRDDPEPLTHSVAVYQDLKYGWFSVMHFNGDAARDARLHPGDVRISEPMELTFTRLNDEAVVASALETLSAMEQGARKELADKLVAIGMQRSQLLSLTHQPDLTPEYAPPARVPAAPTIMEDFI